MFCNFRLRLTALVVLALAMFSTALFSQSDVGTITGFVYDPTGATIPNTTVTISNEATGTERKVSTNQDGLYSVTNIPSGFYSVTAEATGFKKFVAAHNKLDPNASSRVDVHLTIGQATETVEVTASAQTLQTDSAQVEKLVSRAQIDALELNGRNPIYLAQYDAGRQ